MMHTHKSEILFDRTDRLRHICLQAASIIRRRSPFRFSRFTPASKTVVDYLLTSPVGFRDWIEFGEQPGFVYGESLCHGRF